MTTGATSASIVNQALQEIAAQATVSGTNPNFDGTTAGNAAGILYTPLLNELLRQEDPEFARKTALAGGAVLTSTGTTPAQPWSYEYEYPSDCLRVRQVVPGSWDQNNPQPVRWSVGTDTISDVQTKVIFCNAPTALLTYTTSNITEAEFDSMFQEAFVRLLASALVMALGGRPDFSKEKLMEAGALANAGVGRDS